MARFPNKLNKGDTVGIVCPSSAVETRRIDQCIKALEGLGYKVKAAANLDVNYAGYMAGSGEVRGQWINKMFADPEVKAIFCVRGGDGGSRALEYIDLDLIRNNPKIFVGYSDVTSLHLAITQNCEFVTFHGPMVSSNIVDDFDEETRASLFSSINAERDYLFRNPSGSDLKVLREGKVTGELTGGNLSLLSASIGTPYEVDTKDKILFIEEVCEPLTKIEKWTYHLKNAGKLRECCGIVLGQFTQVVNDYCPEYNVNTCIMDILGELDIPVMYNVQSGHGKPMMTLPMGARCTMDTESKTLALRFFD